VAESRVITVRAHTRAAPTRKPAATPAATPKKPAPNTETVRPAQVSTVQRFAPHYKGEPIAGYTHGLQNPDRSWAAPGARAVPGATLGERPYYTDVYTTHHRAGPSGQESTQWNAAQVARAKQIQAKNYGLPGTILRSALPGGLDEGGAKTPGQVVARGADIASYLVPGGGAVKAAGVLGIGAKWLRGAKILKPLAEAAPTAAPATEEAAAVRTALKGAPVVRSGQAAGFSSQRRERFAKAEAIYRDAALTPEERQAKAYSVLSGQLERPVYMGFKKQLDPEQVTNLKAQIMVHNTLRTGQKTKLTRSLDRALAGTVPTAGEQKLFEQTFGKDISGGITQAAKSGRWRNIGTNLVNVPRTLQATADMSAFLRQGFVALGRHPVITSKNFVPMVKAFGSEGYTRQIEHQIANHPDFPLMQVGKLALTGGAKGWPHEEQFAAHMLEQLGGTKNPVHWSSRAYSTFLNKTRADIFSHLLDAAHGQGHNIHDEQFLRDLGELVNTYTGRGGLSGGLERNANLFNGLFFSPRLMSSRLRMLTAPGHVGLARRNPFVYKQQLRASLQSFGALGTMLSLAKLNGLDVGTNPRSADFGKIRFGNTRVDLGAGFLQYMRLLGEGITREYKSSTTGKVSKLGFGHPRSFYDVFTDFMTGKLSPPLSVGADVMKQQTGFGPFDPKQEAISHLTPLSWQDIFKLYKEHGALPAAGGGALTIFGGGVQTYGPKAPAVGPRQRFTGQQRSTGGRQRYVGPSGGGSRSGRTRYVAP